MDFDNEGLKALAHLAHARTPRIIIKIHPYCLHLTLQPQQVKHMLAAIRMIHLMKIGLLTMVTMIVAVTNMRMTVEVLFMQHVPRRTARNS